MVSWMVLNGVGWFLDGVLMAPRRCSLNGCSKPIAARRRRFSQGLAELAGPNCAACCMLQAPSPTSPTRRMMGPTTCHHCCLLVILFIVSLVRPPPRLYHTQTQAGSLGPGNSVAPWLPMVSKQAGVNVEGDSIQRPSPSARSLQVARNVESARIRDGNVIQQQVGRKRGEPARR